SPIEVDIRYSQLPEFRPQLRLLLHHRMHVKRQSACVQQDHKRGLEWLLAVRAAVAGSIDKKLTCWICRVDGVTACIAVRFSGLVNFRINGEELSRRRIIVA